MSKTRLFVDPCSKGASYSSATLFVTTMFVTMCRAKPTRGAVMWEMGEITLIFDHTQVVALLKWQRKSGTCLLGAMVRAMERPQ